MIFSKRIRELRIQHKLTQQQMSERLNMDQSTYSRYENGITIPAADVIIRIAREFKISTDWLLGNEKNNGSS
jgi:transcriptional regulator with XRE-family HTH domain